MPKAIKLEKPTTTPGNNVSATSTALATPDFSALIDDDEISTTGDWIAKNKTDPPASNPGKI